MRREVGEWRANGENSKGRRSFSLMRQLCDAVAHVHARNVCFRDLQPENVMVTNQEPRQVKLIDFGQSGGFEEEGPHGREFTADGDEFVPSA